MVRLPAFYLPKCLPVVALLVAATACASRAGQEDACPISWSSGFRMPELLAESVAVREQEDLGGLLSESWYSPIEVAKPGAQESISLENCDEYFAESTPATRTIRENEMDAFLELAAMCEATALLAGAQRASESYLPQPVLDSASPEHLPAAVALVTSETEAERHAVSSAVNSWGDVNTNFGVKRLSADAVEFTHEAGVQVLEVVGQGDFNSDGRQDVLVASRDSVEDGSYFNLRLFVLTVDAEGEWQLVEEWSYGGGR
jgi:hypothetical protein